MTMRPGRLSRAIAAIFDLVYPPSCLLCSAEFEASNFQSDLCPRCDRRLTASPPWMCPRCAAPVQFDEATGRCVLCQNQRFAFSQALALGKYEGDLQQAILKMKTFRGDGLSRAVGRRVSRQVAASLQSAKAEVVAPVANHWTRRIVQGTNSPDIIAAEVARAANAVFLPHLLVAKRRLRRQAELGPRDRKRNVRGAWRVSATYDIKDVCVAVVDDVMTTGATAHECADCLRKAGANNVVVVVAARGIGDAT